MKHPLLITLCLLLAVSVRAQDKPTDPLTLQPVELETYAQIAKQDEWLGTLRGSATVAFTESDKLLKKCNPKRYKDECGHAITLRQAALALGEAVERSVAQLNKEFEALQKGIRFRVGGDETWQIDWRNRRVVKPEPKGK